ncbi:hypothetical protein NQZ79_g3559 [Umbelopsis isabellina]|nr:hypothetical protein NQZ79_g3559 [Umbelopsis isabellina]
MRGTGNSMVYCGGHKGSNSSTTQLRSEHIWHTSFSVPVIPLKKCTLPSAIIKSKPALLRMPELVTGKGNYLEFSQERTQW